MRTSKKFLTLVLMICLLSALCLINASAKGNRDWKWPVPNSNSLSSCYLDGRGHYALDISAGRGSAVYASFSGTVIATYTGCSHNYGKSKSCGCGGDLGNYVYIRHTYQGINYVSRYGHLTSVNISVGNNVSKDTVIGTVGSTGHSTGNHLDFRIYRGSTTSHSAASSAIDPFKEQFLQMPSGLNANAATTSCCYTYVSEVKSIYSTPIDTQKPTKVLYPTNNAVFKIAAGVGNNMYLDFDYNSDNVQIYENTNNSSSADLVKDQYFKLTHISDGWYIITNTRNGKVFDVWGANSASGANIVQHDYNKGDNQLFRFYDAGGGYCYIKSKLGTYVDVANGDNVNNTNVWAYEFNGTTAQKWKLEKESILNWDDTSSMNNTHHFNTGTLHLHGWAFSDKKLKVSFKYILDSNSPVSVPNVLREDVKKAYPTVCNFNNSGYSFNLILSNISVGKHTIRVIATSTSGASTTVSNICFYIDQHNHSYTSTITTNPTCAKEGVRTYKCSCGASYTQSVAKTAHSYTSAAVSGGKKYTCKVCGYSYVQKAEKTWSEWSTTYPSGVDSKLIESKKEYRYSDYQTTTSYDSSVSGYTYLKSTWEKEGSYIRKYVPSWPSGYPTSSGYYKTYNKSRVNSSETSTTKVVANEPKVYKYIYYHWCRGTYTAGPINRTTKKAKTGEFKTYHAQISATNPSTLTASRDGDGSRILANASCCKDTYWYYPVTIYSQTYTKYKKLNTFYRWTSFSPWSSTAYTASSTRKVETRTLYRYVTYDPDAEVSLGTTSKITAAKTDSTVTLNWNSVKNADGYRVYRKTSSGWKTLADTNKLTYTDKNLKANTKYTFAIRTYKVVGNEKVLAPKYASLSVTTSPSKPAQVKNVNATSALTSVKLTWSKAEGAEGYYVFSYNAKTKKYTSLGKTTDLFYTVKNLKSATAYQFAVQAYKVSSGKTLYGKVSSVIKTSTATVAPELTNARASSSRGKGYVYYTDVKGETGYQVYYSTSKTGVFKKYANFKANTTMATITGFTSGKTYYFKVRTYIKTGSGYVYSATSAVKSIKFK